MNISAQMLSQGKSVIILVPEISLTPQMVLYSRLDSTTMQLYSTPNYPQGRNSNEWERIRKGEAKIIIGARSAIFAPVQNLGLIVIDEEHETSYKSETQPRYDAVEVAEQLCAMNDSILVLGSATPTISRYYMCRKRRI